MELWARDKGREALFFLSCVLEKQKYQPRGKNLLRQFDGCVNCFQVRRLETTVDASSWSWSVASAHKRNVKGCVRQQCCAVSAATTGKKNKIKKGEINCFFFLLCFFFGFDVFVHFCFFFPSFAFRVYFDVFFQSPVVDLFFCSSVVTSFIFVFLFLSLFFFFLC